MKDDALEKLAELEHVQWCDWADVLSKELSSLLDIIERYDGLSDDEKQFVLNVRDRLDRWEGLMIPYSELSEEEKDKDRLYARKILDIIGD